MHYTNLLSFSRKILNRIEIKLKRTHLITKPVTITLEPTLKCNSNCMMCNRNFSRKETKQAEGFLSWETFKKVEPFLKYAEQVLFGGFGEALLHPDYLSMVREIKKHGPFVYFYTNGILMTEKIGTGLVDAGMDKISISMGGASRDTYKKIRGVDAFDKVKNNIRMINEYKKKMNKRNPVLCFNVVAMNSLLNELEPLVELAHEIGVSSISMPNLVVQGEELNGESMWQNVEKAGKALEKAGAIADKYNITFIPPSFDIHKTDCKDLFTKIVVNWDGTIMSCAMERYIIGDLKKSSIEDIWNGEAMLKLRLSYYEKGLENLCPNCSCWDNRPEVFLKPSVNAREYADRVEPEEK